jgi:hypothetical protein
MIGASSNYPHALLALCETGDLEPERASRLFVQTLSVLDRRFANRDKIAELQILLTAMFESRRENRMSRETATDLLVNMLSLASIGSSGMPDSNAAGA